MAPVSVVVLRAAVFVTLMSRMGRLSPYDGASDYDAELATLTVRKALAGVARVHGRFGLGAAVALLRGRPDERLERLGLVRTTTFGVLKDLDEDWLTRLLRRCVTAGWVDFWGGDRPVVILTRSSALEFLGEITVAPITSTQ